MHLLEIILIGVGLSMDAAAVSMTNGMVYDDLRRKHYIIIPLFYGVFQAIMPCLGFLLGGIFATFISAYAGITVFVILGVIGIKMMKDGVYAEKTTLCKRVNFTYSLLIIQATATSIDAFAVGVGFSTIGVNIFQAAGLIGVISFFSSVIALFIGKISGNILGCRAEILGGFILVIMAMNAIL